SLLQRISRVLGSTNGLDRVDKGMLHLSATTPLNSAQMEVIEEFQLRLWYALSSVEGRASAAHQAIRAQFAPRWAHAHKTYLVQIKYHLDAGLRRYRHDKAWLGHISHSIDHALDAPTA